MAATKSNKTGANEEKSEEDDLFDTEGSAGDLFKMEKIGDAIKGLVTNRKVGKTRIGDATFYSILTSEGEKTFVPTKALVEDLDKFTRQFGIGKYIVSIELTELRKGNFPSPFKVFSTKAGVATEARLSALGIATFDHEVESAEEDAGE